MSPTGEPWRILVVCTATVCRSPADHLAMVDEVDQLVTRFARLLPTIQF